MRTADYAKKKWGLVPVAVLVAVAVVVLCDGAFAVDVSGSDRNTLDSVVDEFKENAKVIAPGLTDMSLWLFGGLALISFIWNMGQLLFNEHEAGGFFHKFSYWIMVTGSWFWLLQNGPEIMYAIIDSFMQLGTPVGEETPSPSGIIARSLRNLTVLLWNLLLPSTSESLWSFIWGGGDFTAVIDGYVPAMMTLFCGLVMVGCAVFVGGSLALQLVKAYLLVYTGYFYLAFAGIEYTRGIAHNYLKSVLVAGGELLATLLMFTWFDDVFSKYSLAVLEMAGKNQLEGGPGVNVQLIVPVVISLVMCAYFVSCMPRVLGKVVSGVVTNAPSPFNVRSGLNLATGGTVNMVNRGANLVKDATAVAKAGKNAAKKVGGAARRLIRGRSR